MLIVLICVSGFRYQMGGDSIRYEKYYADTPLIYRLGLRDFQGTRFAPLYIILSSLCRTVTSEFMLLQFVEAIVVNGVFFLFIWKHTRHIFFGGLLYLFFLYITLNMQVLREAFAVSVFLMSWPYFASQQWLKYYLCCLVAFFFHVSSIVLFVLPMINLPVVRELFVFGKRTLIIVPIVLAISFSIQFFLYDFIKLIAVTETMSERANVYSKDELGGNTLNILGGLGQMTRYVLYPLVAMYFIRSRNLGLSRKTKEEVAMERMAMVGVYAATMCIGVTILIRYVNYFEIFALIKVADWVFTGFRVNSRVIALNFVYWMFIMLPLFGAQYYMEYYATVNKTGTLRNIDMYWPYSNQFDREVTPTRKKAIENSQRF